MFGIGGWEMILIMVVALVLFGPKRLPELARSLGRGLAEFRRASADLRKSMDLEPEPNHLSKPDPETLPPAQTGSPVPTPAANSDPERSGTEPDGDSREKAAATSAAVEPSGSAASAGDESQSRSGA